MFSLELALLKGSKRFGALRKQLLAIAAALEEQTAIPGIAAQGELIRSLVGLDRRAAKEAFAAFIGDGTATAGQIEFIDMIVAHLTERGVMEPALLYETPFTDVAPQGPDQVFDLPGKTRLFAVIREINDSAVA